MSRIYSVERDLKKSTIPTRKDGIGLFSSFDTKNTHKENEDITMIIPSSIKKGNNNLSFRSKINEMDLLYTERNIINDENFDVNL